MKAGFSRREITPLEPMLMAGFDRRSAPSSGTLDPLYVSVLALEDESQQPFVICSFDLLGVDKAFCETVRSLIPLAPERIWVLATHTHSGPTHIYEGRATYRADYVRHIAQQAAQAVREAVSDLQPASVSQAQVSVCGVASLRNQGRKKEGYPMPLFMLRFARERGAITFCRFACHPTVLDEANTLFSKDLPGAAGGESQLFANGACADLSTRFTRRESSSKELARLGQVMKNAMGSAVFTPCDCRVIRTVQKELVLSRMGSVEGAQHASLLDAFEKKAAQCADAQARREYDACIAVLKRQAALPEPERIVQIAAADFGPFAIIALPFEIESNDGAALETALSGKPVYALCYAGGYDGYLPSGKPLSENSSYEDIASRYPPQARDAVWECAKQCVLECRRS